MVSVWNTRCHFIGEASRHDGTVCVMSIAAARFEIGWFSMSGSL